MATSINVKNIGNRDAFPTRRIVVEISGTFIEEVSESSSAQGGELGALTVSASSSGKVVLNATSNDVDIKVKLSRNYGGIDPRATVSICNLSDKIINDVATTEFAPKNSKTITVYAGYEKKGEETTDIPLLFSGVILWALPTTGRPDVWFTIQAVEQFFKINEYLNLPSGYAEDCQLAHELVKKIAIEVGYPEASIDTSFFDKLEQSSQPKRLDEYLLTNRSEFSYNSTFGNFMKKDIFQWGRMSAAQMSDKLILLPCSADMDFLQSDEDKSTLPVISAHSNPTMIGIPKPNPTGVDFTTLFDTSVLLPMRRFRLNSFIFPMFDDFVYWVQKVDYDLHLRGQPFYNHVVARRKVQRAK